MDIPSATDPRIVSDGHGNEWLRCHFSDCDLRVVRPGKVQCSNCDVTELRAERAELRTVLGEIVAHLPEDPRAPLTLPPGSPVFQKLRQLLEFGVIPIPKHQAYPDPSKPAS